MTIPIDEGALERTDGNLSVYKWDPSTDGRWHKVETEIDADNLTATTNVSSFSFFTILESSFIPSTGDKTALEWPQLEDFESAARWDQEGNVSVTDGHVTLASEAENSNGGGGGGIGGGDDGDSGSGDGGDTGDDPPEICLPIVGCWSVPWLPFSSASATETASEVATQGSGESARLTRTFEIPAGAERVWFETRASSTVSEGSTAIVVTGESDTEIIDVNEQGSTGWQTHEADLSAFAGEEVTVQLETQGTAELTVDYVGTLVDSSGSGFPDEVEKLDLRMPAGGDGVVGTPLDLDPTQADTSGNGLRDSEVVDIEWRYEEYDAGKQILAAEVTGAKAHPARIDTTSDGLTDRQQLEGWEVEVIDNHDAATELHKINTDEDDNRDSLQFFETQTVKANPLVNNSDHDSLSDVREADLGTDPESRDTTGDGISDDEALESVREDPTVFTTTPPKARLVDYRQWSEPPSFDWDPGLELPDTEGPKWYFEYTFVVEDKAGIAEYEVTREGTTIASGGRYCPNVISGVAPYESLWEGSMTALRGSKSEIYVEDVHGNSQRKLLYAQTSVYGNLAKEGVPAQDVGRLSGFTHSASELPELVHLVLTQPVETGNAIYAFRKGIGVELLQQLISNLPASVRDQQRLDNPYTDGNSACDPGDTKCLQYAQGWYEGYVVHFVASVAYGGTITRGISKATGVSKRLKAARKAYTPTLRVTRVSKTGRVSQKVLADGGRRITLPDGGRIVDNVPKVSTAGKTAAIVKRLDDVDTAVLKKLDGAQRTELLRHLGRYQNGVRLVDDLGPQRTDEFFSLSVRQTDNAQLRENLFRLHGQGVSSAKIDRFVQNADELQGTTGLSDVVESIVRGGGKKNFRGAAAEADVAATIKRSNTRQIVQLSRDISVDGVGSSELDLVLRDGTTIEIKSGDLKLDPTQKGVQQRRFNRLANQLTVHQQYRRANMQGGKGYVIIRGKTSKRVDQLISDRDLLQTTVEELI
ncbi:hypothetical protein [Natrinema marinum]|uniref:hypothetical protein n=1 Tax=Natrinema marinum TaxID=2961598 RepID=UPI0020C8CA7C|nr:hypothetical protein [Natrinema marinum]